MDLALPPNIPTLETSAGNWTRPDNVWCSHSTVNPIITCDVNPSHHPPHANHLPIISVLELPIARSSAPPLRDYRDADFEQLNKALDTPLLRGKKLPPSKKIESEKENTTCGQNK
jgi:hypothetical protein